MCVAKIAICFVKKRQRVVKIIFLPILQNRVKCINIRHNFLMIDTIPDNRDYGTCKVPEIRRSWHDVLYSYFSFENRSKYFRMQVCNRADRLLDTKSFVENSDHDTPSILLRHYISRASVFFVSFSRRVHVCDAYRNTGKTSLRTSRISVILVMFLFIHIFFSLSITILDIKQQKDVSKKYPNLPSKL